MPVRQGARRAGVALLLATLLVLSAGCVGAGRGGTVPEPGPADNGYRTVVDGRGVAVQVPEKIERVVTVSDGFIESVMFVLGEEEKIVGIGTISLQKAYNYTFQTGEGTYEFRDGMEPVTYLCPRFRDLPLVRMVGSGIDINYETVAGLDPDLVILRAGTGFPSVEDEGMQKTIQTIESLGIPLVVLKGYPCFDEPDVSTFSDEIRILGTVFGKEKQAGELAEYLESRTGVVFERTKDIPDAKRPTVLVFNPSSSARKAGGVGSVKGTDTIDSYFIEELVHARNAYRNTGSPIVSAEQLLALDPDVIVLGGTCRSPEELYSAPYYRNLGELSAVKDRRVMSLPFQLWGTKRLEYPNEVIVIAKAAYPERFADIDLAEWLLDHYKNVYGVDDETAKALRSAQFMDWCVGEGYESYVKRV